MGDSFGLKATVKWVSKAKAKAREEKRAAKAAEKGKGGGARAASDPTRNLQKRLMGWSTISKLRPGTAAWNSVEPSLRAGYVCFVPVVRMGPKGPRIDRWVADEGVYPDAKTALKHLKQLVKVNKRRLKQASEELRLFAECAPEWSGVGRVTEIWIACARGGRPKAHKEDERWFKVEELVWLKEKMDRGHGYVWAEDFKYWQTHAAALNGGDNLGVWRPFADAVFAYWSRK